MSLPDEMNEPYLSSDGVDKAYLTLCFPVGTITLILDVGIVHSLGIKAFRVEASTVVAEAAQTSSQ